MCFDIFLGNEMYCEMLCAIAAGGLFLFFSRIIAYKCDVWE